LALKITLSLNLSFFSFTKLFQAEYTYRSSLFLVEVKMGDLKIDPVATSIMYMILSELERQFLEYSLGNV
jgi:hypothetical protein